MIKMKYSVALIVGLAIISISVFLYRGDSLYWFYPAPIGAWLFSDALFYFRGGKTTLQLVFNKKWKELLTLYIVFFVIGILLELIGSILFNLWSYKLAGYTPTISAVFNSMHTNPLSALGWFIYPFMLVQFIGLYGFINSFFKNTVVSTVMSMILGIFMWEIPNVYSRDWVYAIPFVHWSILGVNVVVIVGWLILIQLPVQVNNFLNRLRTV